MPGLTIVLETPRLLLRRLLPGDLDALYALYRDPEIRRYFPDGTRTRDETREELDWFVDGHPQRPELGLWATIERERGAFVGRCGLLPWTIEGRSEVEVAYLLDKAVWGRGLATEAARGIVRHAFEGLGLVRLVSLIDPHNRAAQRVAERIGMTLERTLDGVDGDGIPTLLYATERREGDAAAPGAVVLV